MIYFGPRQRKDGRWDYTQRMDDLVFPTGYCIGQGAMEESELYHDDGHATAEEAALCYRRFCLDHYLILSKDPERPAQLRECAVTDCPNFTAGYASCEDWRAYLCPAHRTRSIVESLMPAAMESWTS